MKRRLSKKAGMSLMEVAVAAGVSAVTLGFSVSVFMMASSSWARGENRIAGENDVRQTVRIISDELREAMWVSVDADGQGLTYRKPKKEPTGEFSIPVVWDGLDRRIELENDTIVLSESATVERVICRGVMTKDPFRSSNHAMDSAISKTASNGSWQNYKIFEPNVGTFTTEVRVTVVTSNRGGAGEFVRARKREVVALRNVPELIK